MSRVLGIEGEDLAENFLIQHNIKTIVRNFSNRFGEIDIIAKEGETLVFVEVKYRRNEGYGEAIDYITSKKLQKILKAARYYLHQNDLNDCDWRIDAIAIDAVNHEVSWLRNVYTEGMDD